MTSLYNISSRYLESYSKYSNYLDLPQTHLQISHALVISILGLQTLPINSFVIFRSSNKNPNIFWTFLTLTSYSNHLILNQMSLNLNFEKWPLHFSWIIHIFASPGILSPCAKSVPNPLFLFLSP